MAKVFEAVRKSIFECNIGISNVSLLNDIFVKLGMGKSEENNEKCGKFFCAFAKWENEQTEKDCPKDYQYIAVYCTKGKSFVYKKNGRDKYVGKSICKVINNCVYAPKWAL